MVSSARTRRSATVAGVARTGLAALLAVLLGACAGDPDEGTNGVGKLSADQIESRTRSAAEHAGAVRLSGTVVTKGHTYRLKMRLKRDGGMGEVSAKGGSAFSLLRVDKDLYMKADADFWARQGQDGGGGSSADDKAAGALDGKYVKVPQSDPAYKQLRGFTDMRVLLDGLLVLDGDREVGDHVEVGGVKAIRVTADGGGGGTIDVSLIGSPFPLRLQRGGRAGTVELADWNKEFPLHAPDRSHVIDYGRQIVADADGGKG